MSRIGRMPIAVPAGVTVDIAENNKVTVKGPKGTLERVPHEVPPLLPVCRFYYTIIIQRFYNSLSPKSNFRHIFRVSCIY